MAANERTMTGNFSRCTLDKPGKYGKYSFLFKGKWDDTGEEVSQFFNTKRPIVFFQSGEELPVPLDEAGIIGKTFDGRALVGVSEWEGRTFYFPNAIQIDKIIGDDTAPIQSGNGSSFTPLDHNPFMASTAPSASTQSHDSATADPFGNLIDEDNPF